MTEEELINPIMMILSPQLIDYVDVPTIKAQLLQLLAKYEERLGRTSARARAVVIDGKKGIRVGDSRQISNHRFHMWKILLFQEKMSGP
ncbi:hypothetical protein TNIN_32841 [Trichonephila inaurata madagascariensis]|uniref:Uncharacterized protein n=1 Tax=Trichonephila inaurata madagascariensis TaxID=2747483 RepID=A0A8X6Y2Y9_9ARAC|nr:hypothetical protein TNIN_32841 [Trichonephila inaurata madagascariensis]